MFNIFSTGRIKNSKSSRFSFTQGFTIVELVMVVAIMAALFTMGTVNYRDYQRRQYLEATVGQVVSDIKLARQLALSGRKPVGCDNLDGYAIQVFDTNTYSIGAVCDTNRCENNSGTDYCVKENVSMPQGITISRPAGFPSGLVTFLSLAKGVGRKTKPEPTTMNADITLSITVGGVADRIITIDSGGSIEIN